MEIMYRQQPRGQDLFRLEQMADVGPAEVPAGVAVAVFIDGPPVFGVLGVACLFRKQRGGVFVGTVVGCVCRFIVHFISGVTIYRIYEPTEVFNTTFTNPYLYSAVYNGSYVFIDMVLCLVITALLYRPLSRYFAPQETVAAVKRNQGPEL